MFEVPGLTYLIVEIQQERLKDSDYLEPQTGNFKHENIFFQHQDFRLDVLNAAPYFCTTIFRYGSSARIPRRTAESAGPRLHPQLGVVICLPVLPVGFLHARFLVRQLLQAVYEALRED
jgi:hypothetical protein